MKRFLYAASLTFLLFPTTLYGAVQVEQKGAATTDIPEVANLAYALPGTWFAIPPIIDVDLRPPRPALLPSEVEIPLLSKQLAAIQHSRSLAYRQSPR